MTSTIARMQVQECCSLSGNLDGSRFFACREHPCQAKGGITMLRKCILSTVIGLVLLVIACFLFSCGPAHDIADTSAVSESTSFHSPGNSSAESISEPPESSPDVSGFKRTHELKVGRFLSQGKNTWYRTIQHTVVPDGEEYHDFWTITPPIPERSDWFHSSPELIKNDCLIIEPFTFQIVDEKTLRYIQAEHPDEEQKQIMDGTLYIWEESES